MTLSSIYLMVLRYGPTISIFPTLPGVAVPVLDHGTYIRSGGINMNSIDVDCKNSGSFPNCCFTSKSKALLVGQCSQCSMSTYLYFDIQRYFYINQIKSCQLILFKLPICKQDKNNMNPFFHSYCLYPSEDFFNIYNDCYSNPKFNHSYEIIFTDTPQSSYSEIDITYIAQSWHNGQIENRGIIITGLSSSFPLFYAAHNFEDCSMRPMLRITYEKFNKINAMTEIQCTVVIK